MDISVVITAHNNADVIEDCLKSVQHFAREIIVVDNQSSDQTIQIAKKYTQHIFKHINNPLALNQAKNYGFSKAKGEWILSLDTDERVSPELATEIRQAISYKLKAKSYTAYEFPRKNIIFGTWIQHGLWYPDLQIRLFKNGHGKFAAKHNHEKLLVDGEIGQLTGHLTHYNYTSVTQYLDKINHVYSDNEAQNFLETGKKIEWHDAIRMPTSDFLTNFFAREGYKDGLHGLALSILQAFYTFIIFAKIWERQQFFEYNPPRFLQECNQEINAKKKEFTYWYHQKTPHSLWSLWVEKFRRKIH